MDSLPTLYEYYTSNGISSGLSINQSYFTLNNKNITLYGGSMHYFRVPQEYWRTGLRKLRAAGLNVVQTYVPWNLHEPEPGFYEFGQGGTDLQQFADIVKFLKTAQEEDLFAVVRPGPYICSEWDFGGMPSWLLREKGITVRSSDRRFMKHVDRYFKVLLSMLAYLQFTRGGPIIGFQIENEYEHANNSVDDSAKYLAGLRDMFLKNDIVELLFTSGNPSLGFRGEIDGTFVSANFRNVPFKELKVLEDHQPHKPIMVTEFWTGWSDRWLEKHQTFSNSKYSKVVEMTLAHPASIFLYMFHGGTNWGFMNGGDLFQSDYISFVIGLYGYKAVTSSYDFDAPISEAGDYRDKYFTTKSLIAKYNRIRTRLPEMPATTPRLAYPQLDITEHMDWNVMMARAPHHIQSKHPMSMEELPINNGAGQQYGYIVYRKKHLDIDSGSVLRIFGNVHDLLLVLVNGKLVSKRSIDREDFVTPPFGSNNVHELSLGPEAYQNATLDIVVENWGRNSFGTLDQFNERKGLYEGPIAVNNVVLEDFEIVPLEFRTNWNRKLTDWKRFKCGRDAEPGLYRAVLNVTNASDTFIDIRGWHKGIVMINGFVLSRYFSLGPQLSNYLPKTFLQEGPNELIFFEHYSPSCHVNFLSDPVFDELPNPIFLSVILTIAVLCSCLLCVCVKSSRSKSKIIGLRLFQLVMLLVLLACVWLFWTYYINETFLMDLWIV